MKLLLYLFVGLSLTSCTVVSSTNIPGEKQDAFPKEFNGKFQLEYPEDFSFMEEEGADPTIVTFKKNVITFEMGGEKSVSYLGDSIHYSTIGTDHFLSMGKEPSITVFKMLKSGKNILLYPLFVYEDVEKDVLASYFSRVDAEYGEPDEEGNTSLLSYSVTIDDKKLGSFFESEYVYSSPFVLKKAK